LRDASRDKGKAGFFIEKKKDILLIEKKTGIKYQVGVSLAEGSDGALFKDLSKKRRRKQQKGAGLAADEKRKTVGAGS